VYLRTGAEVEAHGLHDREGSCVGERLHISGPEDARVLGDDSSCRSQLLYGEWLRRRGRKGDARDQLLIAHDAFRDMGISAFAERARRELSAITKRRTRRYLDDPAIRFTSQEWQIAQLAQHGFSNREIGARLFLSPRTIEWHLRNVFAKVGVSSRRQLRDANLDSYAPNEAGQGVTAEVGTPVARAASG